MTTHDVEPAVSEPNSIAPMALDVNLWEIDLRNLRSGERLDLAIFAPGVGADFDDELSGVHTHTSVPALRPRRTAGRLIGMMVAAMLVGGLGFAGFRARPSLQRALASATASPRVARTTAVSAPALPAQPAQPAPVASPPAPPPAVVAAAPAAAPAPAPAADAPPALPTLSAADLPNAPAGKGKAKAKRGAPKRAAKP